MLLETAGDDNMILRNSPVILRFAWQNVRAAFGVAVSLRL